MIAISYWQMVIAISVVWVIVRVICTIKAGAADIKRELQLLLVYICIVVVVRFTFCPFGRVEGKLQPLLLDPAQVYPFKINWIPLSSLFDYPTRKEAVMNLIGNTTMFIPLGIVWPAVFKKLNRPWKVVAAGFGVSLSIEILQLPFFGRISDVDDLILNTVGYLIGYGIWLLARKKEKTNEK